ncbi:hypothetical protein S40293_11140 [Stachybotrys chartarum IBT 40293]|nr:hypothetical protein S40293_11140 [Stachybotrys chartarum IBT 40293]
MKHSLFSIATVALSLVGVQAQRTLRLPPRPVLPRPGQLELSVDDLVDGINQLTNLTRNTNDIFTEVFDELENVDVDVLVREIPSLLRNLGSLPAILERDILLLAQVQLPTDIRPSNATTICEEFTEFTIAQSELAQNIASGSEFLAGSPQADALAIPLSNILTLVRRLADNIYRVIPSCADDVDEAVDDLQGTINTVSVELTRASKSTTATASPTAS